MKRIRLRWIALLATAAALACCSKIGKDAAGGRSDCANLSGNYMIQGEDGQVHISVEQSGCDRITMIRKSGYLGAVTSEQHALKLNGKVQDDGPWFGDKDQYETSARVVGATIQVDAKAAGGTTLTMIYSLTPDRDLMEQSTIDGRREDPVVAKRQN